MRRSRRKRCSPPAGRRWYPVIDYSRCTNCLECLDFCLFGVYGVDSLERILVENQDQCKKGCPACSRVCPQQAIIFPEYKTAAIAGADTGAVGGLKIDLSKLFGGDVGDALAAAVQERDRELVNDGREAVGMTVGIPKRQEGQAAGAEGRPRQARGRPGQLWGCDRDRPDAPPLAYLTARDALLAERVPAGHWVGELSTSALSTATAVMALHLVNPFEHRERIDAGITWLAEHQNADGGWGDTIKSFSNISTTMLCRAGVRLDRRGEGLTATRSRRSKST